jgi:enoyl-CoA hydratase/carnithine racemase
MTASGGAVLRREADGIAEVVLDRPDAMNALNTATLVQLTAHFTAIAADPQVRVVVLSSAAERAFCVGADLKERAGMDDAQIMAQRPVFRAAFGALLALPQPAIAAVHGYALGGGCELALTADFRICGDNAKLGQPEILLGIIPGAGGTQRLPRLVGPAKAKDLVYSGRFVGAEEALAIGLVDKVVAPDDVYSAAVELVSRYVTGPALALRAAKAAIDGGLDGDLASGLRLETQLFTGLFATEDRAIGMASFVENGPGKAQFVGR